MILGHHHGEPAQTNSSSRPSSPSRAYRLMLWRPGFLFFTGGQGAHILPLLGVHFSEHTLLQGSVLSIPNHRLPSPGASIAEHSSPLQDLHPVRSHASWWDRTLQPGPPTIIPGSPPCKTSLMVRWHSLALLKAQAPKSHPPQSGQECEAQRMSHLLKSTLVPT